MPHKNKSLPKPPPKKKKKAKRLEIEARATSRGMELGKADAHKKKSLIDSAKEHLGHWIDNVDPLELTATLGLTVIIHGLVVASTDLLTKVEAYQHEMPEMYKAFPELEKRWLFEHGQKESLVTTVTGITKAIPDWGIWLTSFSIAYILVKHGGQVFGMLGEGIGGLGKIVGLMLA